MWTLSRHPPWYPNRPQPSETPSGRSRIGQSHRRAEKSALAIFAHFMLTASNPRLPIFTTAKRAGVKAQNLTYNLSRHPPWYPNRPQPSETSAGRSRIGQSHRRAENIILAELTHSILTASNPRLPNFTTAKRTGVKAQNFTHTLSRHIPWYPNRPQPLETPSGCSQIGQSRRCAENIGLALLMVGNGKKSKSSRIFEAAKQWCSSSASRRWAMLWTLERLVASC